MFIPLAFRCVSRCTDFDVFVYRNSSRCLTIKYHYVYVMKIYHVFIFPFWCSTTVLGVVESQFWGWSQDMFLKKVWSWSQDTFLKKSLELVTRYILEKSLELVTRYILEKSLELVTRYILEKKFEVFKKYENKSVQLLHGEYLVIMNINMPSINVMMSKNKQFHWGFLFLKHIKSFLNVQTYCVTWNQ